jgi:N-acetylglucosamine kinase-like BadF-type ATPase
MTHFVAIDGGGTKTTAVIVDHAGNEIARTTTTTSNPSVIGLEPATTVLTSLVADILGAANVDAPAAGLWAGLSGFGRANDHAVLRARLSPFTADLKLTNDVELVLGAYPDMVGIAAIAGTGSIVAGRNRSGDFVRVGGWGHIFGDEGSGYFYGVEALRAVAAAIDGTGPDTDLARRILDEVGVADPFDLIPRIYGAMDKAAIANLSRHTMDAAYHGDAVALSIVERGAALMATMITTAARRLGIAGHLPLALAGGVYLHNQITRRHLMDILEPNWSSIETTLVIDPALTAARSLAASRSRTA